MRTNCLQYKRTELGHFITEESDKRIIKKKDPNLNGGIRIVTYNGIVDTVGSLILKFNPKRVSLRIRNLDLLFRIAVDYNSMPLVLGGDVVKGLLVPPAPDEGLLFGFHETGMNELFMQAYSGTPRYYILEGVRDD